MRISSLATAALLLLAAHIEVEVIPERRTPPKPSDDTDCVCVSVCRPPGHSRLQCQYTDTSAMLAHMQGIVKLIKHT